MKITNTYCAYEPELFKTAFGFKGNKLSGVWQTVVTLEADGLMGIGLGVQSVLWSDSNVFATYGEDVSNEQMFRVTQHAAKLIEGNAFDSPAHILETIFEDCYKYAQEVCGMKVTETFVLNALVPVDFAAHMLWARANGVTDFDKIFPGFGHMEKVANIPLITYGTPVSDVVRMANDGVCLFKIKLGADPDGDGNLDKMLAWDCKRALEIHEQLKDIKTPYTESGRVVYYFDANGRYDSKERLTKLVDFLKEQGILKQVVLFEEPFPQEKEIYVGDLPVCFAADESAHSLADVKKRISLGYKAITLKPIAKTLSVTIDMANCAEENGVQCFCADLTVNPVMVEWNKHFAARLKPLKGMKIGVVESNGGQNYINWERMKGYMPSGGTISFREESMYKLDEAFYAGRDIFETPQHYMEMIKEQNNLP